MKQLNNIIDNQSVNIKGYKFLKDETGSRITELKGISFQEEEILCEGNIPIYGFLSMHAHPSYLGVLQFGQIYNKNEDKKLLETILLSASKLASKFAIDFRDNVIGGKETFEKLSEEEKSLIEIAN